MLRRTLTLASAALVGAALLPAVAQATPIVAITAHPSPVSNDKTPTFKLARNVHYRVSSQTCLVDGRKITVRCATPVTLSGLKDGRHTFTVALVMSTGLRSSASYTWLQDTTVAPPKVSGRMTSWSNAASHTISATATDTGSGVARLEYQTKGAGSSTYSAPATGSHVAITAEGTSLVQFRTVDKAGNTSAWTASAAVELDRSAPATPTVTGSMSRFSNEESHTVSATATDTGGSGVGHLEYRVTAYGGATNTPGPVTVGSQVAIAREGETLIDFRAVDGAGNASAWTSDAVVVLDRTAPQGPGVSNPPAPGTWLTTPPQINADGSYIDPTPGDSYYSAGIQRIEYRTGLVSGTIQWGEPQAGSVAQLPGDGIYQVEFRSVDNAGNVGDWSAPATYQLDTTAPAEPTMSYDGVGTVTATAPASDGGSPLQVEMRFRLHGAADWATDWMPFTEWSFYLPADLQARVCDAAGHCSDPAELDVAVLGS